MLWWAGLSGHLTRSRRSQAIPPLDRVANALGRSNQEAGPAPREPRKAPVDRQRAKMIGFRAAPCLASRLLGIVVKLRDFLQVHSIGGKPCRDVDVAQPPDVGEHFCGAGAGGGARGGEGVADQ